MRAFALLYGPDAASLSSDADASMLGTAARDAARVAAAAPPVLSGWVGWAGPSVGDAHWPRGPRTGEPMLHILTLELPEDYRVRGPGLPAISFFAGEGPNVDDEPTVRPTLDSTDPFLRDLLGHRPHPGLSLRRDAEGGAFAVVWLTREEFERGPAAAPADGYGRARPAGDTGHSAWATSTRVSGTEIGGVLPTTGLWLVAVDDPNAGLAPRQHEWDPKGLELGLEDVDHLGGTPFPADALPSGLSPFYLELGELGGLDLGGGGTAHIDLATPAFGWA